MAERELIDFPTIKILLHKQFSVDEEGNLSDKSKDLVQRLQNSLSRTVHLPYDAIAEYVFSENSENSTEENEDLNANIKCLLDNFGGYSSQKDTLKRNLEKIKRHYNLSRIQKQYISKHTKDTQKLIEQLVPITGTLKDQVEKVSEELDAIKETKSSIYTDFIAILGVFSAFVFVMFGGFSALSEILENLSNRNVSLGSTLLMVGTLVWVILTIIYSMLYWISLFTGKNTLVPKHYWRLSMVCLAIFGLSVILHLCGI